MTGWHVQTQTSACQNVTDVFYGSCSVANSRPIHLKWIKQKTQEEHQLRETQKFTAKVKCFCLLFLPEKESFSLYFCSSSVSPLSPVSNIRSLFFSDNEYFIQQRIFSGRCFVQNILLLWILPSCALQSTRFLVLALLTFGLQNSKKLCCEL